MKKKQSFIAAGLNSSVPNSWWAPTIFPDFVGMGVQFFCCCFAVNAKGEMGLPIPQYRWTEAKQATMCPNNFFTGNSMSTTAYWPVNYWRIRVYICSNKRLSDLSCLKDSASANFHWREEGRIFAGRALSSRDTTCRLTAETTSCRMATWQKKSQCGSYSVASLFEMCTNQ